ncbi:16045_t:CDS:2 [Acaulospora colombiana]|uniref:16045_t:CDS:1 n=1 Tax=Acaulospora colombiana TaxID=27376 RepID=A0ACA9KQE0_9GLOM|nr:16045_t:CDS:2 [Acaulospora colombiana]
MTKIPDEIEKSSICLLDILFIDACYALFLHEIIKFDLSFGIEESAIGINDTANSYTNQLSGILKMNLQIELVNIRLMMFKEQWSSKAKQYLNLAVNTPDFNKENSLDKEKRLAKALDINEIDLPIIRLLSGHFGIK